MSGLMASQGLLQISQAINHLRICIRELSILQAAVADTRLTYACKGWSYQAAMLAGKSLFWRERGGRGVQTNLGYLSSAQVAVEWHMLN